MVCTFLHIEHKSNSAQKSWHCCEQHKHRSMGTTVYNQLARRDDLIRGSKRDGLERIPQWRNSPSPWSGLLSFSFSCMHLEQTNLFIPKKHTPLFFSSSFLYCRCHCLHLSHMGEGRLGALLSCYIHYSFSTYRGDEGGGRDGIGYVTTLGSLVFTMSTGFLAFWTWVACCVGAA